MKNIQVIDDAVNTAYAMYAATEEEFISIFPQTGQDVEFVEDFIDRLGETAARETLEAIWSQPVDKKSVIDWKLAD